MHGLGGSHLNWDLLAPRLTGAARVVALDLPGFGRSEPGERTASVPANVAALARFLEQEVGEPVVLVGNSMGGMISILLTGERPDLVSGLVLLDPAIPGPRRALDPLVALMFALYAVPLVGERVCGATAPASRPPPASTRRCGWSASTRRPCPPT